MLLMLPVFYQIYLKTQFGASEYLSISNKCKYHQQDLYSKRLKNLLFPDHKTKV